MSGFRGGCMLSVMLMVPAVVFGGSVNGAGGIVQDFVLEQDLMPQQTEKAVEQPSSQQKGGEFAGTQLHDEVQGQEPADEMQKMTVLRPNWQKIVGKTGSATVFRRWLAKQPKAYQRMIESAATAAELNESIEEFLASDDARVAAHQEELEVKLAEMRAKVQEQGRRGDQEQRLR